MNRESRPSGAKTRRSNARFTTSSAASPAVSTTSSVNATGKLTVSGETTSASMAAVNTAALMANTRHSSGIALAYERGPATGAGESCTA